MSITFNQVKSDQRIKTYITKADQMLTWLGFTEHSFAHVTKVATTAKYILQTLEYSEKEIELVQIASYLHDIGNLVNRIGHAQSGALMAFKVLSDIGADADDIATIVTAIGHHDEATAEPVNAVAAALILADKTDVRRSRVRNTDITSFDIHDRVNYSVKKATTRINDGKTAMILQLTIDTKHFAAMEYFEIFLGRMLLCRKAAARLGLVFHVSINDQQLL